MENFNAEKEEIVIEKEENISQDEVKSIERIRDEKYYISQIDSLKAEINEKNQEYKDLSDNYDNLQNKYMNLKEDISSSNEDMISHYRHQNESLTKRLEQTQKELSKMREIKNARIDTLESDIDKLQNKVKELNISLQEKLKTDLENLSKSEQADQLMEQIHILESDKVELTQEIERMHIEVIEANTRANDMERVLVGVSNSLNRTNEKIGKCLQIKADLTQEKTEIKEDKSQNNNPAVNVSQEQTIIEDRTLPEYQTTEIANIPAEETILNNNQVTEPIVEKAKEVVKEEKLSLKEKQHLRQEKALQELKEAHEEMEAYQKSEKKGWLSWIANRAASFLP